MRRFILIFSLVYMVGLICSCKSVSSSDLSIDSSRIFPVFSSQGNVSFAKKLKINSSPKNQVIYDTLSSDLNDGAKLKDPMVLLSGTMIVNLYIMNSSNEQERLNNLRLLYSKVKASLTSETKIYYPLYYYVDSSTIKELGQVQISPSWIDEDEQLAKINVKIVHLCDGKYSSVCEVRTNPAGQFNSIYIK